MTRQIVYRRTDPYGTEQPPFVVIAEYTHIDISDENKEDADD